MSKDQKAKSTQTTENSPPSNPQTTAKNGLTTKKLALLLCIVAVVGATIIAAIYLLREKPATATGDNAEKIGGYVMDESNFDTIQEQIEEEVAEGMFQTYMNNNWRFPDGESASSNCVMGNSPNNKYPFWFEVKLKDSGDVVYISATLPVGAKIKELVLDKVLEKGEYPALVQIHMVNDAGEEVKSNAAFNITLTVQN